MLMKKKNVTLIELIVVLAIIGAFTGMTMLSFSLVDSRRIKSEMNSILADISWAREMALSKHENYTVSFNISTDTYTITDSSGNQAKPPRKLSFVDITTAPNTMTFSPPFGRISLSPSSSDNIILALGSRTVNLEIFKNTGYVRLHVPGGGPGCFIATAAYTILPDKGREELNILRKFRDKYLLANRMGRFFVKAYYRFSPPIAHYISKRYWAAKITVYALKPIVWACKKAEEK